MHRSNYFLIVLGSILVIIGTIGIFIPILPTTPFLLLAAACYGRGSKRLYDWLLNNRLFGEYIRNYLDGKGIPLATKLYALVLLWLSISCSAIFFVDNLWIKILLFVIAIGVTIHLLTIKTARKKPKSCQEIKRSCKDMQ